jgi:hypothetical protein
VNLPELNDRWQAIGQPHAQGADTSWHWYCPWCGKAGHVGVALHAAMSDALVHKKHCPAVQ